MTNNTNKTTDRHVKYNAMTKANYNALVEKYSQDGKVFFTFSDGKQTYEVKPANIVGYKDFFLVNGLVKDCLIIGYKGKPVNDGRDYQIFFSVRPAYSEKDKMHNFHEELVKRVEPIIKSSLKRSIIDNKMTYNKVKFARSFGDITYNKETSFQRVVRPSTAILTGLYSTLDIMLDTDIDKDIRANFAVNLDNMNKAVSTSLENADKANRELIEKENAKKTATEISDKAVQKFEDNHKYVEDKKITA